MTSCIFSHILFRITLLVCIRFTNKLCIYMRLRCIHCSILAFSARGTVFNSRLCQNFYLKKIEEFMYGSKISFVFMYDFVAYIVACSLSVREVPCSNLGRDKNLLEKKVNYFNALVM